MQKEPTKQHNPQKDQCSTIFICYGTAALSLGNIQSIAMYIVCKLLWTKKGKSLKLDTQTS